MTSNWRTVALGDVCEIIGGGTPAKDRAEFYGGNIPWATVRDMRSEMIANTEFKITPLAVESSSTNVIPKGNVVIATRVGLGKVCLLQQDTAINQDLRAIIPKHAKQLSVPFLFWWLKSVAHLIEAEGTGATVQGVKLPFIKSLPIPCPPLPEQQRIVAILDEAIAGLATATANAVKNLKNTRELFNSYLDSVFTKGGTNWTDTKVRDAVAGVYTGPFGSLLHKCDYVEAGIPIVNPINIVAGRILPDPNKTVSIETTKRLRSYRLAHGDIVIGRRGEIGRCAVVIAEQVGWLCGTGCFFIRTGDAVNPSFLCHLLRSVEYSQALERLATGATMKNLSNTALQNLQISLPSRSEQDRLEKGFSKVAEEARRLADVYNRKLTRIDLLKQSVLQKAFAGDLTSPPSSALKEAAE